MLFEYLLHFSDWHEIGPAPFWMPFGSFACVLLPLDPFVAGLDPPSSTAVRTPGKYFDIGDNKTYTIIHLNSSYCLLTLNRDAHWPCLWFGEGTILKAVNFHCGDGIRGMRKAHVFRAFVSQLGLHCWSRVNTFKVTIEF